MADGPLIVQSDRTVLLEVAHPDAESARHELAIFAELERAPEHIHTYRITRLGLWNARAAGHDADDMLTTLERWSRFPGAAVGVDRHPRDRRSLRPAHDRAQRRRRAAADRDRHRGADRGLAQQAHPAAAGRPPLAAVVRDRRVGPRAHQAGAAQDRLAGRRPRRVHAGDAASDRARRERTGRCVRTSARPSTSSPRAVPASSCSPAGRARPSSALPRWPTRRRPR